jgi:crotonobetaine/carnitine-CoA ligase
MNFPSSNRWLGYDIRALTIGQIVREKAAKWGERDYLRYMDDGRTFSFAEIDRGSNRLANGLLAHGIGAGAHVAVMLENSPEHLLLLFALAKIGAVSVLVNAAARGDLLKHYLNLSDSTALITEQSFAARFSEIASGTPQVKHLMVLNGDTVQIPPPAGVTLIDFNTCLAASGAPAEIDVRFTDPAHIMFTSGTTGPSKGVLFTHARSLLYALDNMVSFGFRDIDTTYCWSPMFHLSGFHAGVLMAWMAGGRAAMTRRFSVSRLMDDVRESGATVVSLGGAALNMLWARPSSVEDRNHRLRIATTVPMPSFAGQFEERFGLRLVSCYGLTDCGMPTTFTPTDPLEKLGSAGQPRPGWQIKVVDADDFELPPGQTGEILMRCERPWATSSGYYNNPEATAAAWRNGWFHTGDAGRIDEDGYLWFVDRKKDSIRRRGENISAFEVEQALVAHPAVSEAAAFAVKSELGEDEVAVALILRADMRPTEADIIEHCRLKLPYFMVPRYLRFADDLPRNLSNKVQKFKLREECEGRRELLWDREKAGIKIGR